MCVGGGTGHSVLEETEPHSGKGAATRQNKSSWCRWPPPTPSLAGSPWGCSLSARSIAPGLQDRVHQGFHPRSPEPLKTTRILGLTYCLTPSLLPRTPCALPTSCRLTTSLNGSRQIGQLCRKEASGGLRCIRQHRSTLLVSCGVRGLLGRRSPLHSHPPPPPPTAHSWAAFPRLPMALGSLPLPLAGRVGSRTLFQPVRMRTDACCHP